MNYIILAAGMGTRLHPFTKNFPKCMVRIGNDETVIQRMVRIIINFDSSAKITIVTGFKHQEVENSVQGCEFVFNPFYNVTNSIASLWFARHLLCDATVIINGDIVMSEELFKKILTLSDSAVVLVDSSIRAEGDYNVQVNSDRVVVMSKQLNEYYGEYAGVSKFDERSVVLLRDEICNMVEDGSFNEWYENALVQMIMNSEFKLSYVDIADYEWTEIDSVNHLLLARKIQEKDWK